MIQGVGKAILHQAILFVTDLLRYLMPYPTQHINTLTAQMKVRMSFLASVRTQRCSSQSALKQTDHIHQNMRKIVYVFIFFKYERITKQ